MGFVDKPTIGASFDGIAGEPMCAVLKIGPSMDTVWFDTGTNLAGHEPRVYVSAKGIRHLAKALDWVSPEDHARTLEELEAARHEVHDLELQLQEADRQLTAIDVIESAGFRARKKTGRPRKEEAI